MPAWAKVLIAIAAVIAVALAGATAAGFLWMKRNAPKITGNIRQAASEGTRVGENGTGDRCVQEALQRASSGGPFLGQVYVQTFTRSCLDATRTPPALCATAPPVTSIVKAAIWPGNQCAKLGKRHSQNCIAIMNAVLEHCSDPRTNTGTIPEKE